MYVRFGGTIINLEAISYIKVNNEQADFYSVNGALLLTIPTESKDETVKVVENAMSYTSLIQAIDRLKESFDGLSDNVFEVIDRIEHITDALGEQRINYSKAMTDTVERWGNLIGEAKITQINKLGNRKLKETE